jgi:hypothetical protein
LLQTVNDALFTVILGQNGDQEMPTSHAPTVRQALVHAASYITTHDRAAQVLQVDMRPLVIHLLAGLEKAGVERAVVTLGHHAAELAECVAAYGARPPGRPAARALRSADCGHAHMRSNRPSQASRSRWISCG